MSNFCKIYLVRKNIYFYGGGKSRGFLSSYAGHPLGFRALNDAVDVVAEINSDPKKRVLASGQYAAEFTVVPITNRRKDGLFQRAEEVLSAKEFWERYYA